MLRQIFSPMLSIILIALFSNVGFAHPWEDGPVLREIDCYYVVSGARTLTANLKLYGTREPFFVIKMQRELDSRFDHFFGKIHLKQERQFQNMYVAGYPEAFSGDTVPPRLNDKSSVRFATLTTTPDYERYEVSIEDIQIYNNEVHSYVYHAYCSDRHIRADEPAPQMARVRCGQAVSEQIMAAEGASWEASNFFIEMHENDFSRESAKQRAMKRLCAACVNRISGLSAKDYAAQVGLYPRVDRQCEVEHENMFCMDDRIGKVISREDLTCASTVMIRSALGYQRNLSTLSRPIADRIIER